MNWKLSHRAAPTAVRIADRHYNRQKPGTPQFVPPGKCIVLLTLDNSALWVTSHQKYQLHKWKGAWVNSLFRNEGNLLSSQLILQAIAVTKFYWPKVPQLGIITFINASKIKSTHPGYCYLKAGFKKIGFTKKDNLIVLQLLPKQMPSPESPFSNQLKLF